MNALLSYLSQLSLKSATALALIFSALGLSSSAQAQISVLQCEGVSSYTQPRLTVTRENGQVLQVVYTSQRPFHSEHYSLVFTKDNSSIQESRSAELYKLDILGNNKDDLHAYSITSPAAGRFEIVLQGTSPIDHTYNNGYVHFICAGGDL